MKKNNTLFIIVFAVFLIGGIIGIVRLPRHAAEIETPDVPAVSTTVPADTAPAEPEPAPDESSNPAPTPVEQPEAVPDEKSEPESEPETPDEPAPEPAAEPEETTYTVVPADVTAVRVRKTSDRESEVIALLNGGDTGIVLEIGENRSKIMLPDGSTGYVFNEYLEISDPAKD